MFNKENRFIVTALSAYIIIGLVGVFHHEMWHDEYQTWLIGASSKNFGEFLHNMKGEPNPLLWYSTNFILSRFTDNPVIAQIFHFLISIGSVYLILKYAPFSRLQKVLLSFSYYVLFEYTLVARGYALTIFFIFLFCTLYQQLKSKNRYLILSLVLFCLSNVTGHGVIVVLSLLVMMMSDYFLSTDVSIRQKYKPIQFFTGFLFTMIGIAIAIKCLSPLPNSVYSSYTWYIGFDSQRFLVTLRTFCMGLFPVPDGSIINFWNSNIFFSDGANPFISGIIYIISFSIFIYCIVLYSKKLSILLLYLALTCGVMLFFYSNHVIFALLAANHYGFIFIAFVCAAWLSAGVRDSKITFPRLSFLRDKLKLEKNFTYLLTGLFSINILSAAIAYEKDYFYSFSNIKQAADYITSHNLTKLPEVGFVDIEVSPISAYTKQAIYVPDRDTTCRYTTWGPFTSQWEIILSRISNFMSHRHDSALYIAGFGDVLRFGEGKVIGNLQFTRLASYYGAIVPCDIYDLYLLRKVGTNTQQEQQEGIMQYCLQANPTPEGYVNLGLMYINQGRYIEGIAANKKAISLNPNNLIAYNNLGSAYGGLFMWNEEIESLHKALSIDNSFALAKNNLNYAQSMLNNNTVKMTAGVYLNQSLEYYNEGKYEDCVSACKKCLELDTSSAAAWNNMCSSYNALGKFAEAEEACSHALKIAPGFTLAQNNLDEAKKNEKK